MAGLIRAVLMACALSLGGCRMASAVAYKVVGPPAVEAKYTLPASPTLILVEKFGSTGSMIVESETLAREIYHDLRAHKVGPLIDPVEAMDLRTKDPAKFKKMTISQIGAAVGAQHVLYVNLTSNVVGAAEGGGMMQGSMSARVRVIDVATGQAVWPTDVAEGFPVRSSAPMSPGANASAEAFRASLMRSMSVTIGRLFYKWKPEDEIPRDIHEE